MKSAPDELYKQTLTILAREIKALRAKSIGGQLPLRDANTLVKYIGLLKDLRKIDQEVSLKRAREAEAAAKAIPITALVEQLEGKNSK